MDIVTLALARKEFKTKLERYKTSLANELGSDIAEGTNLTLDKTAEFDLDLTLKGNTDQKQYEGNQLFDITKKYGTSGTVQANGFILKKSDNRTIRFILPKALSAGNYTISYQVKNYNLSGNKAFYCSLQDSNFNNIVSNIVLDNNETITFEATAEFEVLYFFISNTQADDATITIDDIMLVEEIESKAFEPYVGGQASPNPKYPQPVHVLKGSNTIKVSNKNWLDLQDVTKQHSGVQAISSNQTIVVSGTATATSFNIIYLKEPITLKANQAYVLSTSNDDTVGATSSSGNYASLRLMSGNTHITETDVILGNKNASKFFTLTEDIIADNIIVRVGSGLVLNDFVIKPQLELDSTATAYEPHKEQTKTLTLPNGMEMCGIEDSRDEFVKDLNSGKWYKNKKMNKLHLLSSMTWITNINGRWHYIFTDNYGKGLSASNSPILSNYFCKANWNNVNTKGICLGDGTSSPIGISASLFNSLADLKTFLDENEVYAYYPLETPVLEEITDTTLINQLNDIKEAYTYQGQTNITQENTDLPFVIKANYKLSNLSRIEALEQAIN